MEHNHCTCEHKLKYCEHCDIVYCEKCKKEWKKEVSNFTWTAPNIGGTGTWPNAISCYYSVNS